MKILPSNIRRARRNGFRTRRNTFLFGLPVISSFFLVAPRIAETQTPFGSVCSRPFGKPEREEIFFNGPIVTPARREQQLTKAPSTISVITAQDISRSGATSIPDLLRNVPGLDFMRTTAADVNIAARGLNQRLSHRMQIFIDGRSVNGDFFNLAFWHELPISMQEIERIEIVRSPASALYGAVAFSGVIHIITKSPEQLAGTCITQTGGNGGINISNLIHAGTAGNWAYKAVFEHDRANHFPNPLIGRSSDDKAREDFRGNVFAEYKFTDSSRASFTAGIDSFNRDVDPGLGQIDLGRFFASGQIGFVKLNYALGDFKLQTVWDRLAMDMRSRPMPPGVPISVLPRPVSILADSIKLEAQHSIHWGSQNVLTGGASYRFSVVDAPLLTGAKREQSFFDAFLQHEYSPWDNLTFTLGLRVEHHPEAGVHVSPRGAIVYSPWENQTFRLSISRAFRNPSVIENFVDLAVGPFTVIGSTRLKPEEITSYELGYQTRLFKIVNARIDLFYNRLDRLSLGPLAPSPTSNELKLMTGGGGSIFGGEVGFEILLSEWLKGLANYSYQQRYVEDSRLLAIAPRHKGNVGLNFILPKGFEADLFVNIVGEGSGVPAKTDAYTLANLHLGYNFDLLGTKGKLNFGVFNLFNDRHREVRGGDIIERRISGGLQFRF